MRNLIKNKKKKGFTLIEMVAVVAIIGILAAILVPKITGYMKEAKKTGVIDQARKVSQAYETAVMKEKDTGNTPTSKDVAPGTAVKSIANDTMLSLLDMTNPSTNTNAGELKYELKKLIGVSGTSAKDITIQDCINITEGAEFNVDENGYLIQDTITTK